MLGLPYSLKTILHEMRGLFIPIWLCLAKIDEVEMFVKARNFLILGLDRIGSGDWFVVKCNLCRGEAKMASLGPEDL